MQHPVTESTASKTKTKLRAKFKKFMMAMLFIVLVSVLAWIVIIFQMRRASFWKSQIAAFEKSDRDRLARGRSYRLYGEFERTLLEDP